mgnify:CR=1 FL=1
MCAVSTGLFNRRMEQAIALALRIRVKLFPRLNLTLCDGILTALRTAMGM